MCGRFALFAPAELLTEYFACRFVADASAIEPRYNVTPGTPIAAVRSEAGECRIELLKWGLVPYWAKDSAIGRRLVNARAETLATAPSFRDAFRRRRSIIPVSGFYEWGKGRPGRRQPFFVRPAGEPLLALAGLWERWRAPDGSITLTTVIVTTPANATLAPIHDRMPLLLTKADHAAWLTSDVLPELDALAERAPEVEAAPVSLAVNDPRHDDASLIEPLEPLEPLEPADEPPDGKR